MRNPLEARNGLRRHRGRGQTVVEFALILPVALMLTVGVLDAARLFAAYISLTNGVREAALYAGGGAYTNWCGVAAGDLPCPTGAHPDHDVSADPGNIAYHIQGESSGLDVSLITLLPPACDSPAVCDATSSTVTITASYPFVPVTPFVSALMGPITLRAATTAQIQK